MPREVMWSNHTALVGFRQRRERDGETFRLCGCLSHRARSRPPKGCRSR